MDVRFKEANVEAVRWRARLDYQYNSDVPRRDACRALIVGTPSADTSTDGWEIDGIVPVSKGGTDDLQSLQPLH